MFGALTGSGVTRMETHLERAPSLERLTMVSKYTRPDETESDELKKENKKENCIVYPTASGSRLV